MQPTERFTPGPGEGLSARQVRMREEEGLYNAQPPRISKTFGQIVRDNLCTFFNLLNAGIFVSLLLVGSYANMLFMGVVLSNLLIGVVQEVRSKRAVERLSVLHMPRAKVVRDSQETEIPSERIVLDDVLLLSMGSQIPTDAVVLTGAVEVDESLLTGEADALTKRPGEALLSGSFVVSGSCRARAERVGAQSYAAKLAQEARRYRKFDSQLMRALRSIIRFAGGFVLPLGALLFVHAFFGLRHPIQSAVEQTAASMLGMIPSGLMLLTSVSLAVGVIALAKRNTLVQELYCIETLSRVDMLCLDKTGTLTTGNMRVAEIFAADAGREAETEARLSDLVQTIPADNATARALRARFSGPARQTPLFVTPFSSARRYSAAAFASGTYYIGAVQSLQPNLPESLRLKAGQAATEGYRVLLFAACGAVNGEPPPPEQAALTPLALVCILDEIRPEAADTLRFFREEGVTVKLISGDDPRTVSSIARRLGLPGHAAYVDASTLADDGAVEGAALQYTIFGRVSPRQKQALIRALKAAGHTVAMTGDGVNDVLALKESDCSVALNAGSDAARQISQLVLLDNDFSALPSVVMEGRRVINNITRTASLFLVKTLYSFLLTVSSLLFALSYPFQPVQLSLIGALTVGIPSFILALEPNRTRIRGSFLKNVLAQAIPGALCIFLYILLSGLIGRRAGLSYAQINTLCVYLTGTTGLCVLLRVCLPLQKRRSLLWFCMTALFFLCAVLLRGTLDLMLPQGGLMLQLYIAMAVTCYPLLVVLGRLSRHILKVEV